MHCRSNFVCGKLLLYSYLKGGDESPASCSSLKIEGFLIANTVNPFALNGYIGGQERGRGGATRPGKVTTKQNNLC